MRILALLTVIALSGCATAGPDYAYQRPSSSDSQNQLTCSSSGNNAVGCGATVVLNSIIHEASK